MSETLALAREALLNTPPRSASELQLPRVDRYIRAEHPAFIEGALYANDWLVDAWRKLEFDNEPSRAVDAAKTMLVQLINTIAEQARLEADHRYPPYDKPTARDIQLGKFIPV